MRREKYDTNLTDMEWAILEPLIPAVKKGPRGYDAGKKIKGGKHHLVVDTCGWVLKVCVAEANYQDRQVACWLLLWLDLQRTRFPRLTRLWADGDYTGTPVELARQLGQLTLEVVERDPAKRGFQRLPYRWVVERTFAWLTSYRRLARDYERLPKTVEAMVYAVMTRLMLRRLAKCP